MKLKTLSFIAGAIAIALTATPFAVQAQTPSPSSQPPVTEGQNRGPWKKLNLTDAQKTQLKEIRQNTRNQIDKILTPEQKAQLEKLKTERKAQAGQGQRTWQRGQGPRNPFASLNLSEDQKAQIKKIMETSKQQMDQVLTPAQQEQINQFRENRGSRRQQRAPQ